MKETVVRYETTTSLSIAEESRDDVPLRDLHVKTVPYTFDNNHVDNAIGLLQVTEKGTTIFVAPFLDHVDLECFLVTLRSGDRVTSTMMTSEVINRIHAAKNIAEAELDCDKIRASIRDARPKGE